VGSWDKGAQDGRDEWFCHFLIQRLEITYGLFFDSHIRYRGRAPAQELVRGVSNGSETFGLRSRRDGGESQGHRRLEQDAGWLIGLRIADNLSSWIRRVFIDIRQAHRIAVQYHRMTCFFYKEHWIVWVHGV